MFIKYILLPDVTKDAKIGYVIIHPKKSVVALEVFDSQHELFIVEYSYSPHAIPASSATREMTENAEELSKHQSFAKEEGQNGSEGQKCLK